MKKKVARKKYGFQPGKSGNPKGRPKKSDHQKALDKKTRAIARQQEKDRSGHPPLTREQEAKLAAHYLTVDSDVCKRDAAEGAKNANGDKLSTCEQGFARLGYQYAQGNMAAGNYLRTIAYGKMANEVVVKSNIEVSFTELVGELASSLEAHYVDPNKPS